jgi:phosphoribulokinase
MMIEGYFSAKFRGKHEIGYFVPGLKYEVQVERSFFGRYRVTKVNGYDYLPDYDCAINYDSIAEMVKDWSLTKVIDPDVVRYGAKDVEV